MLSIGASSSGTTRITTTDADGKEYDGGEYADIDTVAYFSSYGPTTDERIKPEVVAPGDQVRLRCHDVEDFVSLRVLCVTPQYLC